MKKIAVVLAGNGVFDGAEIHENTTHGEIVVDEKYKVITTPCYMLDDAIDQIADGAEKVVETILEMV